MKEREKKVRWGGIIFREKEERFSKREMLSEQELFFKVNSSLGRSKSSYYSVPFLQSSLAPSFL